MIKYSYTILYVEDVTKSIEFYERAFGFKRKFIAPGNSYGELNTGNTTLSFASMELAKSNLKDGFIQSRSKNKPFAVEIAFSTDEVEKVYKKAIQEGAISEAPAAEKPQGQTVAYVRDPDGFLIEICTPMVQIVDAKGIALKELRKIPGVGKVVAMDLWNLGYRSIGDLKGEDPEVLYVHHNDQKKKVQDICMLYTFRAAVYFANTYGERQDKEKLKWWNWIDNKKVDSQTKDAEIRRRKRL